MLTGDGGLLTHGTTPAIVVDTSTVSSEASARMREACAAVGTEFLASPVSGNAKVVGSGKLTLVCSGTEEVFDRVHPLLDHIGQHATYVGEGELARLVKICHNLMLGVVTQNLAEITVLAEKGGVPRAAFLEFLNNSVMGSVFTRYKTPAFVHLDYTRPSPRCCCARTSTLAWRPGTTSMCRCRRSPRQPRWCRPRSVPGVRPSFAVLLDQQAALSGIELKPEDTPVDDGLAPDQAD